MRTLALANQKGGVGKTTTAVHLAHGLSLRGERVALFDLDPQGNATVSLQGLSTEDEDAEFEFLRSVQPGFWLLASPGAERSLDRSASVDVAKLHQLTRHLETQGIGWLIVDCPPRMDQWGWAGLQLCEHVIVPVQTEFFAMHGLSQMLATLEQAQRDFPRHGQLLGVLPSLVDWAEPVCQEVIEDLRRNLGSKVFESVILRDSQVVEASSHGQTVFSYNCMSKAAFCFSEWIREVVDGGS